MYDEQHVFINGESYRAGGRDARMMRELADNRKLVKADVARLSVDAIELVNQWKESGWLHLA